MIEILTYREVRKKAMMSVKLDIVNKGYRLTGKLNKDASTYCQIHSIPYHRKNLKSIINDIVIDYATIKNIKIKDSDVKKGKHINGVQWAELRSKLFTENKNECACCGSIDFLQADHIYPVSIYPEYQLCYWNLQILCRTCNVQKGNRYVVKYSDIK
jgi:5-methylcytosine-specific restriction endonuclease McrA